jgi:hypothetical protein
VEREIWGWTWADGGVRSVAVRAGGEDWRSAEVEAPRGRQWRRFSIRWTPRQRGAAVLASRAEANDGQVQPVSGRRNAIYAVEVIVV